MALASFCASCCMKRGEGFGFSPSMASLLGYEISHKFQHARCVVVENVKYSAHFVVPKVALLFINCSLGGKYLILARGCFGAIALNWSMQKMVFALYKYTKYLALPAFCCILPCVLLQNALLSGAKRKAKWC